MKNAVMKCVFGDMNRFFVLLAIIGLMYANHSPTYADCFKISLCRLPKTDDFNFFVKNLRDESSVLGRFIDGNPDIQFISENGEVTETSEHHVSFDISGRSFIIESDGTVTIDNKNIEDRFYISAVSRRPFPPAILLYNRAQTEYVPFKSKDTRDKADQNGFEIVQPDEWVEKHCKELCNGVDCDPKADDKKDGSCRIF